MNVLLTDRLTCPRCGPAFGLILLADRVVDRRVLEGRLGCPNCRDQFPVEEGFGDLRAPPRKPLAPITRLVSDPEAAETLKVAAMLGVSDGSGWILLIGDLVAYAAPLGGLVPGVEIVASSPELRWWAESEGLSRITAWPGIPFYDGTFRGVGIGSDAWDAYGPEAVRMLAPRARIVVAGAGEGVRTVLEGAGLTVLLAEEGYVVAARS